MQNAKGKMQNEEAVTDIWKEYQKGLEYQTRIGLRENVPKYVDFYEGRQWPSPTENTKNLPRPVINIIKMICRNKKSALLSTPTRLVFKADNGSADAKQFTQFGEYIQKEMRQREHDKQAVLDGVIKGSYFYHFYWDSEAVGLEGQIEGGVRCENVDPLDIFFENPRELDEQKQKWIIISSRVSVDSVKKRADKDVDLDLIIPDEQESNPYHTQEQDEGGLCTVLTKYYRQGGAVYCVQATKNVVFKKAWHILPQKPKVDNSAELMQGNVANHNPISDGSLRLSGARNIGFGSLPPSTPLAPQHEARPLGASPDGFGLKNEGRGSLIDVPNTALPDDTMAVENTTMVRELYPIVAGYYERREKCIYGLSEVEGLIPNQKAINFHLAMSLLNAQEMAWGKWVVMPNALKGQKISNVPGQVLVDHSGTGTGIRKMSEQTIHSLPIDVANVMLELTRSMAGATEVMSGELPRAGMSGAAIAQLQAQAQQPIEELRDTFWLVKEKQGLVLAQFFKHFYYYDKKFSYQEKAPEGGEPQDMDAVFNSSSFEGVNFSVVVEATQGTRSSVVSDINMLESLLQSGAIDVHTYIAAYPDSAIGNKSEIMEMMKAKEQSEVNTLKAQVEELNAQLEQSAEVIKRQDEVVQNILPTIQENNNLNAKLAELQAEYTEKITAQNGEIGRLSAMYEQADRDAGDFAEEILKKQETDKDTSSTILDGPPSPAGEGRL